MMHNTSKMYIEALHILLCIMKLLKTVTELVFLKEERFLKYFLIIYVNL